jgi:hypothetical protein
MVSVHPMVAVVMHRHGINHVGPGKTWLRHRRRGLDCRGPSDESADEKAGGQQ